MKAAPTLKNIATACGVSHVTVWRALKNHTSVHPETAAKIRKQAREIGWEENHDFRVARAHRRPSVRKEKPSPIIVPYNLQTLVNPDLLFWDYFSGITQAAAESSRPLQVVGFNGPDSEQVRIQTFLEESGGGILDFSLNDDTIDYLHRRQIPFVSREITLLQPDPKRPVRVYADHIQGFLDAWRLLLDKGHQRIGFIGFEGNPTSRARVNEGLAAAQLLSRQQGFDAKVFIPCQGNDAVIWDALRAQLGKRPTQWPSAFFCTNDECAHQVMSSLQTHGLTIPDDLSIIGFDDTQFARISRPAITTIAKPRRAIGEMMFRLLEQIMKNGVHHQPLTQAIPMHLVVRNSVGEPRTR